MTRAEVWHVYKSARDANAAGLPDVAILIDARLAETLCAFWLCVTEAAPPSSTPARPRITAPPVAPSTRCNGAPGDLTDPSGAPLPQGGDTNLPGPPATD